MTDVNTDQNTDQDKLPPTTLDLDALERDGATLDPFSFAHNGRRYTLLDPKEVDWQDLISALSNPFVFFEKTLAGGDQAAFLDTKMPAWKLNKLIDGYMEYYGLPSLGEQNALPR
jgi:hypothetical protein